MSKFNTIDGVLRNKLIKERKPDERDYFAYLAHAMSFLNQRDRVLAATRRTVEIQLGSDRLAYLPDDFVDWLAVGREVGGKVVNLAFNERVPGLPSADKPAGPIVQPGYPVVVSSLDPDFESCCVYQDFCGNELRAYGGGIMRGEFTVSKADRTITATSVVDSGPLLLYYTANLDKPNEATPLDPDLCFLLEKWIDWQENTKTPLAAQLERYYNNELRRVSLRANPLTADMMYNILDETYGF